MNTKKLTQYLFALLLLSTPLFAADKLTSGLNEINSWLMTIVGPAILVFGIVWSGYRLTLGDRDGLKSSLMITFGGGVVTAATSLKDLIVGFFS